MNVTTEQLAQLLAGIARAQQAIVDAIESENGGWRNAHLINKLTVAASLRLVETRLIDIPSRILLRQQTRVPMNPAQILQDLEKALAGTVPVESPPPEAKKPGDDLDFFNT